jgi:hypothetical protein
MNYFYCARCNSPKTNCTFAVFKKRYYIIFCKKCAKIIGIPKEYFYYTNFFKDCEEFKKILGNYWYNKYENIVKKYTRKTK